MFKIWHGRLVPENQGGRCMRKLKLPVIKEDLQEPRSLSMDEYLKFVQFNLRHAFDKRAYARWKKLLVVDVPFSLK